MGRIYGEFELYLDLAGLSGQPDGLERAALVKAIGPEARGWFRAIEVEYKADTYLFHFTSLYSSSQYTPTMASVPVFLTVCASDHKASPPPSTSASSISQFLPPNYLSRSRSAAPPEQLLPLSSVVDKAV